MANVLLTGGAGYIGSHTVVELLAAGHQAVIADNFCNSSPRVLDRLQRIVGRPVTCERGDIRDESFLSAIFKKHRVAAVIHFAALKAVGESCEQPLEYFENNISGTICLLKIMRQQGVGRVVFSSSATVYGLPTPMAGPN